MKIKWKIIAPLDSPPLITKDNIVFNISPSPGMFSQFGAPDKYFYVPYILDPSNVYHQALRNYLSKQGFDINDKKFPYKINLDGFGEFKFSLSIKLFPQSIISLTLTITSDNNELDCKKLIDIQYIDKHKLLKHIIDYTIGVATSLNHKQVKLENKYISIPAVFLNYSDSNLDHSEYAKTNLAAFIGILIRNVNYHSMSPMIVDNIRSKNKEFNVKGDESLILIDKQGMFVSYVDDNAQHILNQTAKYHDMIEIVAVFNTILDKFGFFLNLNDVFSLFLLYKMKSWIKYPEVIFKNSVSNKSAWALIINEYGLIHNFNSTIDCYNLERKLQDYIVFFAKHEYLWWTNYDFPAFIKRDRLNYKTRLFSFINDDEYRNIIIDDYYEAKQSYDSNCYKATMILCGSIIEALLSILVHKHESYKNDNHGYTLKELLVISKDNKLVTDIPLLKMLDALRDFRNMIHPNIIIRKQLYPDNSMASISLAVVDLLIKHMMNAANKYNN